MRNWIDNIPAMSGQQDFQRSSWDMVEAAQEAMSLRDGNREPLHL